MMAACAAAPPPPGTALKPCIACAALPRPSISLADTAETRRVVGVIFAVWACACAPEIAEERGVTCAAR